MEHLGKKAKDTITGFQGTATSFHSYMEGFDKYGIEKLDKDGKPIIEYFGTSRLLFGDDIPKPRETV